MGLWLLGAFWSLPFQLIISLVRWANEANRVDVHMESQAQMDENKRKMSDYPASMLTEMRGGNSLHQPYLPHLGTEAEETI
jgi:hypothetical protein